jgi:hypothetical protein
MHLLANNAQPPEILNHVLVQGWKATTFLLLANALTMETFRIDPKICQTSLNVYFVNFISIGITATEIR